MIIVIILLTIIDIVNFSLTSDNRNQQLSAIIVVIREIFVNFQCNLTIQFMMRLVLFITRIELTIIVIFVHGNNRIAKCQYHPSLLYTSVSTVLF